VGYPILTSGIFCVRGGDALFPNDFGEDSLLVVAHVFLNAAAGAPRSGTKQSRGRRQTPWIKKDRESLKEESEEDDEEPDKDDEEEDMKEAFVHQQSSLALRQRDSLILSQMRLSRSRVRTSTMYAIKYFLLQLVAYHCCDTSEFSIT